MFEDYLEGVKTDLVSVTKYNALGRAIQPLWEDKTEAWKQMDILLIGVPEGRETGKNHGTRLAADAVRKELLVFPAI
jgi:arginase family enzyme